MLHDNKVSSQQGDWHFVEPRDLGMRTSNIISTFDLVVPLVRFCSVCLFGYSSHVSDVGHIP